MKRAYLGLFVVLMFQYAFAQNDYKGILVDSQTAARIPFVNIGILEKGVGTVSNADGVFHLELNPATYSNLDTLQFSSLGYKTINIAVYDLKFKYNEYPQILMEPEVVNLNEVIVTHKTAHQVSDLVGYQNYGEKTVGYWKDHSALGGELATKIRVKKGLRKLNTLFFDVFSNASDSLLLRVNIYNLGRSKNRLGENLNSSNKSILHTIYRNTRLAIVDLAPYEIYLKNDFVVSLELLEVYGDKPVELVLSASSNKGTYSLRKFASLDKWEIENRMAMAYYLNTTYFSDKKNVNSKAIKARKSKKSVSGFIFSSRRALANVKVTNLISNEEVYSNSKGRYQILAEKNDLLRFEKAGFKKIIIKLLDKNNININMFR